MSIFSNLFKRRPIIDTVQQDDGGTRIYAPTQSGVSPISVDYGNGLYASDIIMQSIRCKATEFKKLKPRHIRSTDGKESVVRDSSVARLLRRPNDLMTQSEFLEKATILLELNKNVYIYPSYYISKAGEKIFTKMDILRPAEVDILVDSSGIYFYKFTFANGEQYTIRASEIIHWKKDFGVNDYFGGNGAADYIAVRNAVRFYDRLISSLAAAMDASYRINGIMQFNSLLANDEQRAKEKEFAERVARNESGILITDMKGQYTHIPRDVKIVDAATTKFLYENIIRANGTSLAILSGDYTKAQKEAYYEHALEADIKALGEAMTRVFFTEREQSFGNEVILYPNDIVFMSMENRLSALDKAAPSGYLTRDEGRELIGYPPLPEGMGGDEIPRGYNNVDNQQKPNSTANETDPTNNTEE